MTDLPQETIDEAERLTRLARDAVDPDEAAAYRRRRDDHLAKHGFRARVRNESLRNVLVLHPDEWVDDGVIKVEDVENVDRAVEIPIDGPGEADDWSAVDEHNRTVADRVADEHGELHGANATAFADFMGNHYARQVETATVSEINEFLTEFFPRNVWPTDEQEAIVRRSVELTFEAAGERVPPF